MTTPRRSRPVRRGGPLLPGWLPRLERIGAYAGVVVRRLAERTLPTEVRVFNLANGAIATEVINALVDLGIPDALAAGDLLLGELAAQVGAQPDPLHRVLRMAETMGLVRLRADLSCSLTRAGEVLRSDAARMSVAPWTRYNAAPGIRASWAAMADVVRTGVCSFDQIHGMTVWDWYAAHPEESEVFHDAMRGLTDYAGPRIAAAYPWPVRAVVCDLAGGVGSLLSHVLQRRTDLRGILLEHQSALQDADDILERRGVRDRVDIVAGDIFHPLAVRADIFVLKEILHDWDDDDCRRILRHTAVAMTGADRLVVVEILHGPVHGNPIVPIADLTMLTQTSGGRQRTLAEVDELFAAAGLRRTRTFPTAVHTLIEAALVHGPAGTCAR